MKTRWLAVLAIALINAAVMGTPQAASEEVAVSPAATQAESTWQARIIAEKSKVLAEKSAQSDAEGGLPYGKVLEGLAYCLAVFLVGFHLFKKFHGKVNGLSQRNMRLIETVPLSPKTYLHLVEVNQQKILVSSGQQAVSFIKLEDSSTSYKFEESEVFSAAENVSSASREQLC